MLSRDHQIEHLKLLIAKLERMQFGRRSEKIARQIEQLELKLEELEANRSEQTPPEPEPESTTPNEAPSPQRLKRRALAEHLPRETRTHAPAEECCPDCGGALAKLGEDISEMLEYVPASFKIVCYVRPKLSCTACDRIV